MISIKEKKKGEKKKTLPPPFPLTRFGCCQRGTSKQQDSEKHRTAGVTAAAHSDARISKKGNCDGVKRCPAECQALIPPPLLSGWIWPLLKLNSSKRFCVDSRVSGDVGGLGRPKYVQLKSFLLSILSATALATTAAAAAVRISCSDYTLGNVREVRTRLPVASSVFPDLKFWWQSL